MDLQVSVGRSVEIQLYSTQEQRQLRDLPRYHNKLIQQIASEKNRMMRVLEDCNIKLSCVVSDRSGAIAIHSPI